MPLVPPWRRRKRPRRERLGHEQPGTVLRGPPIALTCECGEKRELAYGERWRCQSCGRSWDTNRIPAEQYQEIRRISRTIQRCHEASSDHSPRAESW